MFNPRAPTIPRAGSPSLSVVPPSGPALFVLEAGDTLASLASALGVPARQIAALNVASIPADGAGFSCAEGRAISAWVLERSPSGVSGVRLAPVAGQRNECEPGLGFAAFAAGQAIRLPPNSVRRPLASRSPSAPAASSSSFLPYAAAALAGYMIKGVIGSAIAIGVVGYLKGRA